MVRKFSTSYDELIKNYYGGSNRSGLKDAVSLEELFANYYGKAAVSEEERKKKRPAMALSFSRDDGEVLMQRPSRRRRPRYGYQQSTDTPVFEEYVLTNDAAANDAVATQSSVAMSVDAAPSDDGNIREEYTVDILAPLEDSPGTDSRTAPDEYKPAAPALRQVEETPHHPHEHAELSHAKVTDDDIIGDLEAILKGEKVYDPQSKSTVDKNKLSGSQSTSNDPPAPNAGDGQAIFDRIAQSMTYANAYDLGTVELENRFSDFDRMSELQEKAAQDKKKKSEYAQSYSVFPSPKVDNADFLEDLDAIRNQHYSGGSTVSIAESMSAAIVEEMDQDKRDPVCRPFALSLSATDNPADYSRPLYDSGEHVMTGWDLYTDQLRVGKPPGVQFSYGHLIAMGDLYATVDQMMNASEDELLRVKGLLNLSQRYYSGHRADKSLDVSDDNWANAIGDRYIDLAEDNYSHFAPNNIFRNEPWVANVGRRKDNKSEWEMYHRRAITEAQKVLQSGGNTSAPPFLEWPLIINGFGDHFLTDAFAAGHTISKDATIERFKFNFYSGKNLKPAAEKFFERLAKKAFKGEVAQKFSVLETFDPVFLWWNPNIDTVNAFRKLLIAIAEQKPDEIGNLAVKALHDELNKLGVEVTNDAGDGTWRLTGDGLLDSKNLEIIKQAVQQSVDNVNDPANRNTPNIAAAIDKVWKHVPRLTDPGKMQVRIASERYTDPESDMLVEAAAALVAKKVNIFIDKLLKAHKLKRA
jgi:hypothetical protein